MSSPRVTVVVPTLHAGEQLDRCLNALAGQSFDDFETIVVDNSGCGAAADAAKRPRVRVIANRENVGFGAAINQGIEASASHLVCTLNDDAVAHPEWLSALAAACERDSRRGMCASRIVFRDRPDLLDSAALAIYPDATTKQRGHRAQADGFAMEEEALLPSGCAALYRREMLDEIGSFDGDYFLYCEDADVGLRGRLAGWGCGYAPEAVVEHDYSGSAGRASQLKAFYVERNRLFNLVKLFPVRMWWAAPFYTLTRYWEHWLALRAGRGLASELEGGQNPLRFVLIVLSAHWSAARAFPSLWRKRRDVKRYSTLNASSFRELLRRHSIRASEIAAQ